MLLIPLHSRASELSPQLCARPAPGSVVPEPFELHSKGGVLEVELTFLNFKAPGGQELYCYRSRDGSQAPTLRLQPGDLLIVRLKNRLTSAGGSAAHSGTHEAQMPVIDAPCASAHMTRLSTNLHFHGTSLPPRCHADDVLHTFVPSGGAAFEYRVHIPPDEPPGLYWYHPHVHGFTNLQVLGGASGALIVEGIERANHKLAGLPERSFIIRDQELLHPDAQPTVGDGVPAPPPLRDAEGDVLNTGNGSGKPAKDLTLNFVPIPYPDYPPALINVRPLERQLWRILNGSAITYLDLQIVVNDRPLPVGVVALDGVPINENGMARDRVLWVDHVFLPPGARVEWIYNGVPPGANARLITRSVDTGTAGENDPVRPLAAIVASNDASEPQGTLLSSPAPLPRSELVWLGNLTPKRTRKLYFSERPEDPNDPNSRSVFMITVEGRTPTPYDPRQTEPDISVHRGDVEDWIIENRSREMHAFHIHQIHFILTEWNGAPVNEPLLHDTINVPSWDGQSGRYPSVTLRMDFRDPNVVGTFVYHCHLLEHEDGGMMGTIQVLP
jgi:FtsP/CotA-like multicopper oxidase with cupredoxin domain